MPHVVKYGKGEPGIYFDVDIGSPNITHVYLKDGIAMTQTGAPHLGARCWLNGEYFDIFKKLTDPGQPVAWFKRADGVTVKLGPDRSIVDFDNQTGEVIDGEIVKHSQDVSVWEWPQECFGVPGPFELSFGLNADQRIILVIHGNVIENKTSNVVQGTITTM